LVARTVGENIIRVNFSLFFFLFFYFDSLGNFPLSAHIGFCFAPGGSVKSGECKAVLTLLFIFAFDVLKLSMFALEASLIGQIFVQ